MLSRCFATTVRATGRALSILVLAAALIPGTFTSSTSAQAEPIDAAARLQIVLESVYILDDQDLTGSGELELVTRVGRGTDPSRFCDNNASLSYDRHAFRASSGDTVTLDVQLPEPSGPVVTPVPVPAAAFPLETGQQYLFCVFIGERDRYLASGDSLGEIFFPLDESNDWSIGTHTVASSKTDCSRVVSVLPPETEVGACYTLTFEVRLAPLPDLHPTAIQVLANPGGGENVCLGVENLGPVDAGPFEMIFRIDDQDVANGTVAAGGLPAGQFGLLCTPVVLPRGQHTLSSTVDEARLVPEQRETNNRFERKFVRLPGEGVLVPLEPIGGGTVQPPQAPPDLVVQTLNIAHNPDGSGKCQGDTTNYLFAQVKNVGQGPAGEFAVGLEVRGNLKQETVYVQGLAAGEAVDVRMATDDLNAGPQAVKVIADGDNQVAESNESSNALEVTATCD